MLTHAYVMSLLSYDPATGVFRWQQDRASHVKAGDVAGSYNDQGYWRIKIDGKQYRANRLAWLMMKGGWPAHEVDHANGIRDDNRWDNLRAATRVQNEANKPYKGVRQRGSRFQARIRSEGRRIELGWYATEAEAMAVYRKAAQRIHGDFARAS